MNSKTNLTQPKIRRYLHILHHLDHFGMYTQRFDEKSLVLLDDFFKLIEQIAPISENGTRSVWLTAPRGTFDDFGNIDQMIDCGEFNSKEEALEEWKWMYPDETAWYELTTAEDRNAGYRVIYLCHRCAVLQDKRRTESGEELNISEFVQWLIDSVKDCIQRLDEGTYNDYLEQNLPPQHRTGTIKRKHFWNVWPENRADFFKNITEEDVTEFIRLASSQPEHKPISSDRIKSLTANDFFSFCAMGYAENNYSGCDKTPKEQYYLHADGRDEGLHEIDENSTGAFENWLNNREHHGGHPWEICRGGNSTHIDLMVSKDDDGYFLYLAGSAWTRTIETVKFYLVLTRAGIPVLLRDAHILAERLSEEELIGIVPEGVMPAYCQDWFPEEEIIDFINLPYEDTEEFLPFCHWKPIEPVSLLNNKRKDEAQ